MEINRGEMRIDVGRRVDVAYMQWISGRGVKTIDGGCVERYRAIKRKGFGQFN